MRKAKSLSSFTPGPPKRTSTSGKPSMVKTSSMPKRKKATYKKYRGQGR